MRLNILFITILITMLLGCTTTDDRDTRISFHDLETRSLDEYFSNNGGKSFSVSLSDLDKKDFQISGIDKIIYRNDNLYVLDWISRKILIYKRDGIPVYTLSKFGRGPQEYLQISDFDIDGYGNIIILDGKTDKLLMYSPQGELLRSKRLMCQISAVKVIDNGYILMAVSPWDNSKYKNYKVLIADWNTDIVTNRIRYDSHKDPNYTFPSPIFHECDSLILYHQPIDDYIYTFDDDGNMIDRLYLDFGNKSIPKDLRTNIERNREEIKSYSTLINSVYVSDNYVVGSILNDRIIDFVIDRNCEFIYMDNPADDNLRMIGISENRIIFQKLNSMHSDDMIELLVVPIE